MPGPSLFSPGHVLHRDESECQVVSTKRARTFVKKHGVVLVSARGPAPRLVDFIAGETVKGSWWGHPKGTLIFNTLEAVTDSPDLAVCRLVGGKLSLVHKRLWPALLRMAGRFPRKSLARVRQEHTASGKHVNTVVEFPKWVPKGLKAAAADAPELTRLFSARTVER